MTAPAGIRDTDVAVRARGRAAASGNSNASRACDPASRLHCSPAVPRFARTGPIRAAAWAAALSALPGCFYTGSIDEPPRAQIEKLSSASVFYPGDQVELVARKSSDAEDGSLIQCRWSSAACKSPSACDALDATSFEAIDTPFTVHLPPGRHDPVEVQLACRDQNDVVLTDTLEIPVGNRAANITIQVPPTAVDHFVVTVPIEVAATVTDPDPGDVPELTWQLDSPRASNPNDVGWDPVDDTGLVYRLVPDVPGLWQVEVTADDGVDEDGVATQTQAIVVDTDHPPCIALTSPAADPVHRFALTRDDGPRTFALLSVTDDLDPYPTPPDAPDYLGAPSFTWQLGDPASGGQLVPLPGGGPEVTIDPANYAPGDDLSLRVEVADRQDRTLPCSADQPTCSIGGDACLQRVTWEVEIR